MMGIKSKLNGYLRRVARRPRGRRLAAGDGQRLRDDRQRRLPQPPARDQEGRRPRTSTLKLPRALARAPREGVLGRRDLRGDQDPRAEHPGRHGHARATSAARPAARPARPTRTSTPGSSASRRGSRPPCGSASRATRDLDERHVPRRRNIDGGTYPADIWGDYMKKAVGKYCGDFKQPTEPFQSQPFFGHYAREGAKDDDQTATARRDGTGHARRRSGQRRPTNKHEQQRRRQRQPARRRRSSTRRVRAPPQTPPETSRRPQASAPAATARHAELPPRLVQLAPSEPARRAAVESDASGGAASDGYRCREVVQRREGLRLHHAR